MGIVYEAEQLSLGRRVALKVLPFAATLDARQLQRFHNEARAAAGLHHEHIVPVHGVGCERGVHFYAMQFIDGTTLAEMVRGLRHEINGPASPPDARPDADATTPPAVARPTAGSRPLDKAHFRRVAELIAQAADALEYAHSVGVVHRDVKPGNLMLDASGKLWVTDFGLAKQEAVASLTVSGDLVGTLRYMSPEQALAKHNLVDHCTDVYSLGATLYELLTLRPAVDGPDKEEILRRIAFEEPTAPRRLNRAIPVELETIVLKALEKAPQDRYATAQELADDFRRFLEDRPIRVRRPSVVQRLLKWARRNRAVVAAAAIVLVIVVMALAVSTGFIWQAKKRAEADLAVARAVQEFLRDDLLGQADLGNQRPGPNGRNPKITVRELLDRAAAVVGQKFQDQPLVEASIRHTIGSAYLALGEYASAQPQVQRSLDLLLQHRGADHPHTLNTMNNLALVYHCQGEYDRAEPLFLEVLQARTAKFGADHPDTLSAKDNLAMLYLDRGKYDRAELLLQQVLQEVRQGRTAQPAAAHPSTLTIMNNLASLYHKQGKYDRAGPLFQEVLEGTTAKLGPDHPHTLVAENNLAAVYRDQGKYDRAEPLFQHVLQAQTTKLGADDPRTLTTKNNLAMVYHYQGNNRAEPLFQEVLEAQKVKLGADHPATLNTMNNLAAVYHYQGKYDRAEPLSLEVLQARTAKLGADHPDTLSAKHNLAMLYWIRGKYDRAEILHKEVLQARRDKLGADHPETLESKTHLAMVSRDQGKYDRAEPLLQEALQAYTAKLGADHPGTLECKDHLATLYRKQRRYAMAELLWREVLDSTKRTLGAESSRSAAVMAELGRDLLPQRKYAEAERFFRECLKIGEQKRADGWSMFDTKSLLGLSLLGQQKYAEAEPLLLSGYEGLKQREVKIPPPLKVRLTEALERLVQFYDAWGKKDQADQWRQKLSAVQSPMFKPQDK
jgi:tetratricopeptide (TPR) repeat protein